MCVDSLDTVSVGEREALKSFVGVPSDTLSTRERLWFVSECVGKRLAECVGNNVRLAEKSRETDDDCDGVMLRMHLGNGLCSQDFP